MKYLLLILFLPTIAFAESVKFVWDAPVGDIPVTGYKLYISPTSGVYGPPVSTVLSTSKTYTFYIPTNMQGVFFVTVTAYNSVGESERSNEISFIPKPKPAAANNLRTLP